MRNRVEPEIIGAHYPVGSPSHLSCLLLVNKSGNDLETITHNSTSSCQTKNQKMFVSPTTWYQYPLFDWLIAQNVPSNSIKLFYRNKSKRDKTNRRQLQLGPRPSPFLTFSHNIQDKSPVDRPICTRTKSSKIHPGLDPVLLMDVPTAHCNAISFSLIDWLDFPPFNYKSSEHCFPNFLALPLFPTCCSYNSSNLVCLTYLEMKFAASSMYMRVRGGD